MGTYRLILALLLMLLGTVQAVEHVNSSGIWIPAVVSKTVPNVFVRLNGSPSTVISVEFGILDGSGYYTRPDSGWSYSAATGVWSTTGGYSEYFNGGSWTLIGHGRTGFPPGFSAYKAMVEACSRWCLDNSVAASNVNISAFLSGYVPSSGEDGDGGPTDGPQQPPAGWDHDWPYKPGDDVPPAGLTLFEAMVAGIISPVQYEELLNRGWRPGDFLHSYSQNSSGTGIVLGRNSWPQGNYNISWEYNNGSGWQSAGWQQYQPGETQWHPSGPYQPPTQAPPDSQAPPNDSTPDPVDSNPNETPGADDSEELNRINDNIVNLTDVTQDGMNALIDQNEDTQDILLAINDDLKAQLEAMGVTLKDLQRLLQDANYKTDQSNALLRDILEELENITENTEGGSGGGPGEGPGLPPYPGGDLVGFASTAAQEGNMNTMRDSLASRFNDVPEYSGSEDLFSGTINVPLYGGGYEAVSVILPDSVTGFTLWSVVRAIVRAVIMLSVVWALKVSIITTLRSA